MPDVEGKRIHFMPWGRWQLEEDGRVCVAFRCTCSPTMGVTVFVKPDESGKLEVKCPRCQFRILQILVRTREL